MSFVSYPHLILLISGQTFEIIVAVNFCFEIYCCWSRARTVSLWNGHGRTSARGQWPCHCLFSLSHNPSSRWRHRRRRSRSDRLITSSSSWRRKISYGDHSIKYHTDRLPADHGVNSVSMCSSLYSSLSNGSDRRSECWVGVNNKK